MASGGISGDIEGIRRRFRLIAVMGVSGDLVVLAVLWLIGGLPQDLLVLVTVLLLAGSSVMCYLFLKVLPDRIARQKGKA